MPASSPKKAGFHVEVDNTCDDWDYADAARYLLERFHELRALHPKLCLISVGEVTVTLDRTPGAGGRNQQFVMECALELESYPGERLTVLSAGSDGIDGNTQVAGAIADPTTVDPRPYLRIPSQGRRWPHSMPVPCSLRWATPSSPAQPGKTCATCAS